MTFNIDPNVRLHYNYFLYKYVYMSYKYYIIDNDYLLRKIYSSHTLALVCIKYLQLINDKLIFLINNNITVTNKLSLFSNLSIVLTFKENNKLPCVLQSNIHFDLNKNVFVGINDQFVINDGFLINMINAVSTNYSKLSSTQHININTNANNNTKNKKNNCNESNINIEEIVKELEDIKKTKSECVKNIEESFVELKNDYFDTVNQVNNIKKDIHHLKEKEESNMRIYDSDKNIYQRMKHEISLGTLDENNIPEIFSKKYLILKFLDEENLLDTDDAYQFYSEIYNDIFDDDNNNSSIMPSNDKPYIPHDYHYRKEKKRNYENINVEPLEKMLKDTYDNEDEYYFAKNNDYSSLF